MKKQFLFAFVIALFSMSAIQAQLATPKGFAPGTILLPNNQTLTGYIKESMKKSASVCFLDSTGNNKKIYEGNSINGVSVNGVQYMCVQGDFFKCISLGKINFMQKCSNAAGKISYNGTEPVLSSGTDGKIGDYFTYTANMLKPLTKKTVEAFIANDLATCPQAIEKAKTLQGDITKMYEAIDIYNSYTK